MNQHIRHARVLILPIALFALFGCSGGNDNAPAVDASGKHPADWYTAHRQAYSVQFLADGASQCRQCHGADLTGGITKVGCSQTSFDGLVCHAGGHPPRPVPHAVPFKDPALHGPAAKADLTFCQTCHATSGGPGSNPRFNVKIGTLTNGCEDCHADRTAHPPVDPARVSGFPSTWNGHASAGNLANACVLCHGISLGGGVGPACNSCHTSLAVGSVPTQGSCVSCHGKPPVTGSHTIHNGLAGVTGICDTCHNGLGSGAPHHGARGFANVSTAFAASYSAKSGQAHATVVGATVTCQNVSCHGGNTTPAWGGSIDPANRCVACHTAGTAAQTPQYNSYYSGEHTKHVTQLGMICTDCHDMTVTNGGNSHFSGLATPTFELQPRFTIRVPGYATTPGSCTPTANPAPGTYSLNVCHSTRTW